MAAKRIKAFNALLKELNTKEENTLFSPAKSVLDLFNFQEKFKKTELIEQNVDNFEYIQKMYACTIKNTKERNEFIEKCDSFNVPILSSGLNSLISEMTPLIEISSINSLFNADELANPGLLIAKLMDPNNSQMKLLTEQFRPIIESKIKSGELDPSKITEEISKLF